MGIQEENAGGQKGRLSQGNCISEHLGTVEPAVSVVKLEDSVGTTRISRKNT